jgi:translation elongation factor P/translation initiation factor 5A
MELSRRFDGKKFMWDGQVYADQKQAEETINKYQADKFQTQLVSEDNQYYVFTRREVKEIVIEAQPT